MQSFLTPTKGLENALTNFDDAVLIDPHYQKLSPVVLELLSVLRPTTITNAEAHRGLAKKINSKCVSPLLNGANYIQDQEWEAQGHP